MAIVIENNICKMVRGNPDLKAGGIYTLKDGEYTFGFTVDKELVEVPIDGLTWREADCDHIWEGKYDPKLASKKHIKTKDVGANS